MTRRDALFAVASAFSLLGGESNTNGSGLVRLQRVPSGGIQPEVVADHKGAIHVVYYGGDPFHGDIFYTRSTDGGATFSSGLRVNRPGTAIAAGTIRGAQLALGGDGMVHVAWNGSASAALQGPI